MPKGQHIKNERRRPTTGRAPGNKSPVAAKEPQASDRAASSLLSWRPIVAAYDTLRTASVPDTVYSAETLEVVRRARELREFVSWDAYLDLLEQAYAWCGSDERFIDAFTNFDRAVPEVRAFATPRVGVREFALFIFNSYDSASYPEVWHEARVLDDGRLDLEMRLPPHYRDGRVWFVGNIGALRSISRHLGLPLAHVEAEIGSHYGRFHISFPTEDRRMTPGVAAESGDVAKLFNVLRDDLRLAVALRGETRDPAERVKESAAAWGLTPQETRVLGCICRALANKEIAAELNCSPRTVEVHVTRILAKAGLDSRTQLVAYLASSE